jgi:dipeptidyl-peptidase-4
MIKKQITFLTFALTSTFIFSTVAVKAQSKLLTIEDAVLKQKTSLAPEKINQLTWIHKNYSYAYIEKQNGAEVLVTSNVMANKKATLATLTDINTGITKLYPQSVSITKFPLIKWIDQSNFFFTSADNKIFKFNIPKKSVSELNSYEKEVENVDLDENKFGVAYTKDNNLFISTKGIEKQITHDTNKEIVNGQAAHRNEFGIKKGIFWSPKGNSVAYYHMDQTMVTNYPLVDIGQKPAVDKEIKYPMAGMASHHATVAIYNLASGKTITLNTGEPADQYLTNITWSNDEQKTYIAVVNRAQNEMKMDTYDANTGSFIKTLFEETDSKYVEPEEGPIFLNNHTDNFLWFSKRDGYRHLYLYDNAGTNLGQLTKGNFDVTDFVGFDAKCEHFFYISNEESPIERHIYNYDFAKHTSIKLSTVAGTHTTTFSEDGNFFTDTYSSTTIPRVVEVCSTKGKKIATLLTAENPLKDYAMGTMKLFTIKAADNTTDLYCRQILPPNFDATKKYPVLVYLYGGPHVQLVNNTWLGGGDMWLQYMAQQGYVVFTLDSRGSGNRGQTFEQATYRQLGTIELADQTKGFNYLKSLNFVDTTRMGIHGWSFGGFMTITVMTKAPTIFKAAVAGGPVIDWKYYEVMYTERYMDTPQENPKGYEEANLLNYVNNLKGKLLLIHGTADDVVVWQHSLMYLKKCIDNGVQLDYFVYPGHKHNVLGTDRVHLMTKITNYFNQNLKNTIN